MRFLDVAAPYYPEGETDGTWISLTILGVIILIIVIVVLIMKSKKKEDGKNEKDN